MVPPQPSRTAAPASRPSPIGTGLLIHLFAAAHALTAVVTRLLDYYDDIPLTLLTIAMLIVIALRRNLSIYVTVLTILTVTLTGYLSGVWLGQRLNLLIGSPILSAAIITFALTELYGWCACRLVPNRQPAAQPPGLYDPQNLYTRRMIVIAACSVLLLRVVYAFLFHLPYFRLHGNIYDHFGILFSNTIALLFICCAVAVWSVLPVSGDDATERPRRHKMLLRIALAGAMFFFPLLPAALAYYDFPWMRPDHCYDPFDPYAFAGLYAVALLAVIIGCLAAMLVRYAFLSRRAIHSERSKKHSEQYKYAKLKQQISPHFLFNSLNILDSLVQSGENERAATYIRKLAALYRYILKNENEPLVLLSDELEFTEMYVDLLKERFIDGLQVDYRIAPEARRLHVVPCGLQMLIENATKHNTVNASAPLRITVQADAGGIEVSNNLQPRISTQPSSRLGLQNIDRQYRNIAGTGITVERTEQQFRVKLPLL